MQDEQAHFSPSITGMPENGYGLVRSSQQQLATGSWAGKAGGAGGLSTRGSKWYTGRNESHTGRVCACSDARRGKIKNRTAAAGMLIQTPEGILVNGMLDEDRERRGRPRPTGCRVESSRVESSAERRAEARAGSTRAGRSGACGYQRGTERRRRWPKALDGAPWVRPDQYAASSVVRMK